jgi:UDP-N-acetylglucosamine 4,6-dehydratase
MQRLLLTGGSGTVGNAFIQAYADEYEFHIFSRNEKLQHSTKTRFPFVNCHLGTVDRKENLYNVCDQIKPDVIVHAAALKHVDVAEKDPISALKINCLGSLNVIEAAVAFKVPVTVAVSTDKACNHQNIYGMTKYLMERCFLQADAPHNHFAVCRFANVAHSNGSVIPLWLKSKQDGKHLRVTDPSMNRLMFSQQEAAGLVKKCIDLAEEEGGFILTKLMKSVNILKLAQAISDDVEIIGARPGEKINEDLISVSELLYTQHVGDNFIRINKTLNAEEESRLGGPLNTHTAGKMTDAEIRDLVFKHVRG